jgi:hypothetical protein
MCQPSSLTREKDERLSREGDNSGTSRVRVRVGIFGLGLGLGKTGVRVEVTVIYWCLKSSPFGVSICADGQPSHRHYRFSTFTDRCGKVLSLEVEPQTMTCNALH